MKRVTTISYDRKANLFRRLTLPALLFSVLEPDVFAQPDPNWLDHDRARPLPPVIVPATAGTQDAAGKPPSDATVLFDGKDLSPWVSMDGSPTKWVTRDGYMECVK